MTVRPWLFLLCVLTALLLGQGALLAAPIQAEGIVSLTRTNFSQLQEAAVRRAMQNAVDAASRSALGGTVHARYHTLLDEKILAQAEVFVTTYALEASARGETTYSVRLGLELDGGLLRRRLLEAGLLKGPLSPRLAAVFIALDPSWPAGRGLTAPALSSAVGSALEGRSLSVVPPPEVEKRPRARLIPAPVTPAQLATFARMAGVDVGVGVEGSPSPQRKGLLSMKVLVVDAVAGSLLGESSLELEGGSSFRGDITRSQAVRVGEVASALVPAPSLPDKAGTGKGLPRLVTVGGSAFSQRDLAVRLATALGEETPLVMHRATKGETEFYLTSKRPREEIRGHLADLSARVGFLLSDLPDGYRLDFPSRSAGALVPLGREVLFYRRAPRSGVSNPDDIRKREEVAWEEAEPDNEVSQALSLPFGATVLGRIDPARDRDLFRCILPLDTTSFLVSVEQTGPGDFRPSVRIHDPRGRLIASIRAPARGRSLNALVSLPPGAPWVLVGLEDHLGRSVTRFPYVLTVGPLPAEDQR